jgi:hypothetical protein
MASKKAGKSTRGESGTRPRSYRSAIFSASIPPCRQSGREL